MWFLWKISRLSLDSIAYLERGMQINWCLARCAQNYLSLRDQCAHWSWQSPNNSGRFVRAFVRFRYISPLTGELPRQCAHWLAMTAFFRVRTRKQQFIALCGYGRAQQKHPPLVWWGGFALGNTVQWGLRASVDLLPQSCSMKNGKYIQYSRIFHTFACVKISHRFSLPHYAVLPLF